MSDRIDPKVEAAHEAMRGVFRRRGRTTPSLEISSAATQAAISAYEKALGEEGMVVVPLRGFHLIEAAHKSRMNHGEAADAMALLRLKQRDDK